MKILLTGAAGYVGSELLSTLVEEGHDLWCVTRSAQLLPHVHASQQIVHDLGQPLALRVDDFDLVIHAAGANDVQSRDPASALALTTLTARHCAEFALRQKSPRLLYFSTFQVYGRDEGSIDESTPCVPRNDYALTHFFAEQWIAQHGRSAGLEYVLLRPANIAGIPSTGTMRRWTLAPGCFCVEAYRERRIVVRSTGLQQRDFLPLREVTRRVAVVAKDFDRYANGAINICSGASLTIAEVARIAADRYAAIFGTPCQLEFQPPPSATANKPPTQLHVSSVYLADHPDQGLSRKQSVEQMTACVDDTYRHLQRSA